jgi:signal transduction histidine kinase
MDQAQKVTKRWWQLKLRGKFILVISGILLIIFASMAFFLIRSSRASLTNQLNRETQAFSTLATKPIGDNYSVYSQSGTILIKQQMQKFIDLDPNVSNIAVVNLQGLSQFSYTGQPLSVSTQAVGSFDPTTVLNPKGQIIQVVQPYINDSGQHSYAIAYQISSSAVEEQISHEEQTIIILTLLSLFVSALAAYEFINAFFLRPLNSLTATARIISGGKYDSRARYRRYDEIGTLAGSIDGMADTLEADIVKLKELDKQKDEFIKIVSHNLRTPLTIIQSNAAFLESAQLTPILKKMVQGIEDSARRLNLFSEQILTISDFESQQAKPSLREEVTLNDLLGSLSREYEEFAKTKQIGFETKVENGSARFFTSRYQIASAVKNLLDNAFKFTPENGKIELAAQISGDSVSIKVSDSGIGIKDEEMPKLFTKFHRGNETLVYNYEGTGIGLYVTKLLVEQAGGKVMAQSKLGEGSTFTIELPYITSGA